MPQGFQKQTVLCITFYDLIVICRARSLFQINLFKIYILNKEKIKTLFNICYFKLFLLTYFLFNILNKFLEFLFYIFLF